jgi:hypothetical protein
MQFPQQPVFQSATPFQQASVYQQYPSMYAPPYSQVGISLQQPASAPSFQQLSALAQNVTAKNKRKKKKNVAASSSQSVPPQQLPFAQTRFLFIPDHFGGMVSAVGFLLLCSQCLLCSPLLLLRWLSWRQPSLVNVGSALWTRMLLKIVKSSIIVSCVIL